MKFLNALYEGPKLGVKILSTGGSGGGSAAAGGLGRYTAVSGPAPDYGSPYLPQEYGGNGGTGGGASVDSRCSPHVRMISAMTMGHQYVCYDYGSPVCML